MRHVDAYLSRKAQEIWPDAVVYKDHEQGRRAEELFAEAQWSAWQRVANNMLGCLIEASGLEESSRRVFAQAVEMQRAEAWQEGRLATSVTWETTFVLEGPGVGPLGLGHSFGDAKNAIAALRRQKEASHGTQG